MTSTETEQNLNTSAQSDADEHDPHYEPIIQLPVIEVSQDKTGHQ